MASAILRIFSGLHLGAEIELAEGVYVIGTDDSCDLILSESSLAPRHAALHIVLSGDSLLLTAESLDGEVKLNGRTIGDEADLPARTPFQLGLLTAAWLPAEEENITEIWSALEKSLLSPAAASADIQAASESLVQDTGRKDLPDLSPTGSSTPANTDNEAPEESSGTGIEAPAPSGRKRIRDLSLIAAMLLAASLCFTWNDSDPEQTPAQRMRCMLDEAGYSKLQVAGNDKSVVVTGRIATDKERGRLLRLAQLLDFPVYLDVNVHSDAADAVRASYNALGLWPEVTELPPSARPGVRVRGYIKNGFLEEQALSSAVRNVPLLRPDEKGGKPSLEIFSDIRHEEDIDAVLTPALAAAGLSGVEKLYLPGRIEVRGMLTPQSKAALEEVLQKVSGKLGIAVPFDIFNEAEEKAAVANIYTNHGSLAARKSSAATADPVTFKVLSVSMGAMKFVTLANGERVFEGGELPGGFILESIGVDSLTLSKGSSSTIYPLRGSNE